MAHPGSSARFISWRGRSVNTPSNGLAAAGSGNRSYNRMKASARLPNWDTLAGRVLDSFFAAVHEQLPDYDMPLTLFGSAPIQLCLDEDFTSADVDIMVLEEDATLRRIAHQAGVGRSGSLRSAYGVQICPPQLFKPTPHYLQRAHVETRHGLTIIVPHLRDILIGKLHRSRHEGQEGLVPKDLRAFQRVRELCGGHPTLPELLEDLISLESSFRPTLDGSINSFRFNVEDALSQVYQHRFNLQQDILKPAAKSSLPSMIPPTGLVAKMLSELG
jgi:hypothetical protein